MPPIAVGFAASVVVIRSEVHRLNSKQVNLTDEQVRGTLDRELPMGTDKPGVKPFLDAKGRTYSDSGPAILAMVRDASPQPFDPHRYAHTVFLRFQRKTGFL